MRERIWLRRLAASLVVDAAQADDLTQEALLTALQRPPRSDDHPRAWLATVVRSLARQVGMSERRRNERERRVALHERQPATDEVVARAELQHAITAAVLALDEPYKTTLLLRFFEDLTPRAIAKRTDVPIETVRTRLKRGVELVRSRLVAQRGGAVANPVVALLGLLDDGSRRIVWRALAAKAGVAAGGAIGPGGLMAMSMTAKLALAGAVVAGGALAWLTLRVPPHAPAIRPETRDSSAAASSPEAVDLATERDPAVRTANGEDARAGSDAWLARFGLAVTPSPSGGLPLSVVTKSSGAPAVGVTVFLLDEGSLRSSELASLLHDPERLARKCVEAHRTNERGQVRVHWSSSNETRVALALDGAMRAAEWIQRTPLLPIVLELAPPAHFDVAVRDRAGAAVEGAWVDFGYGIKPSPRIVGAVERARTRVDGIASIEDADLRPWTPAEAVEWSVQLEGRFEPLVAAPIDVTHFPEKPLVLTIGAAGAIEFEIQDDQARTLEFDGDATVDFMLAGGSRDDVVRSHLRFEQGRARVAPVALGCTWSVWVRMKQGRLRTSSGAGPTRDGETIHATLTTETTGPILTGRLIDHDGTPLADRALRGFERAVLDAGGRYRGDGDETRTDQLGRFSLDFQFVDLDVVRRPLILTALPTATREARRAYVELPPRLTRNLLDLGDVMVEAISPSISGLVVRSNGEPVAEVEVRIERLDAKTSGVDNERFGFPTSKSDEDGRFAILGWPAGRYRVSCRKSGYGPPRELGKEGVLELPARDVTLTIDRDSSDHGLVIASVRTDPLSHQLARKIVARFRRSDGHSPTVTIPFDDLGRLSWNTEDVGLYDVDVTLSEVDDPRELLVHVEGIEVNADAVTCDPRLQQIDLRGRLREVQVTVVDPDGRPAKDALVRAFVGDAPEMSARFAFAGAEPACFLTTQPIVDVDALGQDGTFASLPAASGVVTLKLERVDPVRVQVALDPPDALAGQPFELTAILLPARSRLDGWANWLSAKFDTSGVATLTLPCGGDWRVQLMAHGKHRVANRNSDLLPDTPMAIPDGAREAACTVTLDEKTIEKFVEETREE